MIELLIVIAIIGILAAIAIASYLGQRERAQHSAIIASSNEIYIETYARLNDFSEKAPMLFLGADGDNIICREYEAASSGNNCLSVFNMEPLDPPYADLGDVLDFIMNEYNVGRDAKTPYSGRELVYADSDGSCNYSLGQITICNTTKNHVRIVGITPWGGVLYNSFVSSR